MSRTSRAEILFGLEVLESNTGVAPAHWGLALCKDGESIYWVSRSALDEELPADLEGDALAQAYCDWCSAHAVEEAENLCDICRGYGQLTPDALSRGPFRGGWGSILWRHRRSLRVCPECWAAMASEHQEEILEGDEE